jgi:hypothetical protein
MQNKEFLACKIRTRPVTCRSEVRAARGDEEDPGMAPGCAGGKGHARGEG